MTCTKNRFRGFTIAEVAAALVVAACAAAGLVHLVSASAAQRRASETRRLAIQEIANQAERLSLETWDNLTPERLASLKPEDELLAAVPGAKLTATLAEEAGPPAAKRVRLSITWTNSAGQPVEPLSLTIWKHETATESP
jgi:hypothetical protein